MEHVTKLTISIEISDDKEIESVLKDLPAYCISTFSHSKGERWKSEFQVSCPSAPELAEGDFVDDLCPYFPVLLALKTHYSAQFELQIAVGDPAPEFWELEHSSIALLAALGASVLIQTSASTERA